MNALFAMGTPPTIADDKTYFLWAGQNWMFLVLPTLTFVTILIAWVIRRVRACIAGTSGDSGATPPSCLGETMAGPE